MPFIYTALYIIALVLYLFASDRTMEILDTLFYISPIAILCNIILSRILELCKWHKMACSLPLLPQVNILIDRYVYEFSVGAITIHIVMVISMAVLLLIAAYNVFLK